MPLSYKPTQNKVGLKRAIRRSINGLGRRCRCCICGRTFYKFSEYRGGWNAVSSYLKELEWTGSDFDRFWCPFCRSHDRERHLKLYFDALDFWLRFKSASVLHIAPEKHISRAVEGCNPERYVKGDLEPVRNDIRKMDVTDINESDSSFDIAICNHVLEHVPDDRKALCELFRVLKPGGIAILQTPYALKLTETREQDPSVVTGTQRLEFYGQEDHIRLYGLDLPERIREAGFDLTLKTHTQLLPDIDCVAFGVNQAEPLFYAQKPVV
ncbi:MAG: methyltransferase domain-containing protein [Kiritimatiellia bacterium]